ncbi:MAG: RNA polymerase subunit sigma-70 [Flavobacterium sp.]|nr:MAG: RNA polymerase subunit sigma-70 [Flavobacterium sp.]
MTEEFIIQFKNKNAKAFDVLYENYKASLLGVIYNIVKDKEIAKDVLQDVFVKIWKNAESYSPEKGRFFTWIINIARNSAIDKVRSKNYKQSNKNYDVNNFVDIIESNEDFNTNSNFIGIKAFISKLTEKCKNVIDLLFFKGFTQKETAEALNIPLGTVKTRNRTCINELRVLIGTK